MNMILPDLVHTPIPKGFILFSTYTSSSHPQYNTSYYIVNCLNPIQIGAPYLFIKRILKNTFERPS